MPDLTSLGYISFAAIFEDELIYQNYNQTSDDPTEIEVRLKTVYNLAKSFNLLGEKFRFLHGDIKSKSLFINFAENKCAIIDFDGGTFMDSWYNALTKILQPLIFGEVQPWLAPEILKEVNEETKEAKLKVNKATEFWSFACGAYTILTGIEPYSFLNEFSYNSLKGYLKNNTWPQLAGDAGQYKMDEDQYQSTTEYFSKLSNRKGLWQCFLNQFNNGFSKKDNRASYAEWIKILSDEIKNKQPNLRIKVRPKYVLEGKGATISWACSDGVLSIEGTKIDKDGKKEITFNKPVSIDVINEFGRYNFPIQIEIVKKPTISGWSVSSAIIKQDDEIKIGWTPQNIDKVVVVVNQKEHTITDSFIRVKPEYSQEIIVNFYSKFDLEFISKSVRIEVFKPIEIEFFEADKMFIAESLPLNLKWVVNNAESVSISGINTTFDRSGETVMRPNTSREIILSAKNRFYTATKAIYIQVIPVPKIENLKLPALPNFKTTIPDFSIGVPLFLEDYANINDRVKKIFNEK